MRLAVGTLHEDACGTCRGRFLDGDASITLFSDHLGISREVLRELTRDGPRRLTCPGCASRMTLTLVRGVQVDLCGGCGGAWLDEGELSTLTRGLLAELHRGPSPPPPPEAAPTALLDQARAAFGGGPPAAAASGLELERAPRAPRPAAVALVPEHAPELPVAFSPRRALGNFEVCCINCDQPLDLAETNWLINQRPWCPTCAAPHTGLSGLATGVANAAMSVLAGRRLARLSMDIGGSMLNGTDSMKVPPADAERFFGPFFKPVRPR